MVNVVPWDEVQPIAEEAFNVWVGQPELTWAKQAWAHLTTAGLATAETQLETVRVYIRFLVLASFYRDWCATVWDEVLDDSPADWLGAVEVDRLHVGRLLGSKEELSDEGDLDEALSILMQRERKAVVTSLLRGFGDINALFVALWRSNHCEDEGVDRDEDDDDRQPPETDADILNDPSEEKLAGYSWLDQGCQALGPTREHADFD